MAALGGIGFLLLCISLIVLLVALFKKNPALKSKALKGLGLGFVLFIVGAVMGGGSGGSSPSEEDNFLKQNSKPNQIEIHTALKGIAKRLREEGRQTVRGKQFSAVTVRRILSNPLYVGDLLLQKVFVRDCITKKVVNNIGQRDRYYVKHHHAAIVDRETYDKVQEVLTYRTKMGFMLRKGMTCFTHKIQCGICGKWYSRFSKDGYVDWICSTRRKGKDCSSKYLPDRRLTAACCRVLGLEEFDGTVFTDKVEKIVVPEQHRLVFHMKDGTVIDETWEPVSRKEYWTPERRAERSRQYKGRRFGA